MKRVILSLGGNEGDVFKTLHTVMQEIELHPSFNKVKFSSVYQTTAVSDIPQSDYLNCACTLYTELSPFELQKELQAIETKFGKVDKPKNYPRPIDIDIILYGNEHIEEADLQIPHPRYKERLFVLVPMNELVENYDIVERVKELKKNSTQKIEILLRKEPAK